MSDILQQIQSLQFHDRSRAEALLQQFIQQTFHELTVAEVQLRPQAVSLNSFNGFITLDTGERLFFKTHTEEDNAIDEYYNATLLAEAGYPVIKPLHSSTRAGQHLLIYEVIDDPSVFDLSWAIEQGQSTGDILSALTTAQRTADRRLFTIYTQTLKSQALAEAQKAPIHQLFFHRLVGGRFNRFYGPNSRVRLPDREWAIAELFTRRWVINGQTYAESMAEQIERAKANLTFRPDITIIGHGDAHNGNVFFQKSQQPPALLYFDPAFAGRHHPLLDLTKPLFHNVFAMWMYFPEIKHDQTRIALRDDGRTLHVEYDYSLPDIRHMFLRSKVDNVLIPALKMLQAEHVLRHDWRKYIKSALLCCPLLTMNLTDSRRFPPEISLLGLTMTIEMGGESQKVRSLIDSVLDEAATALT